MRRIVIEEQGAEIEASAPPSKANKKFDLQDALLAGGILFLEIAAWVIWRPSAFVLAGLFCLSGVFLIEKDKKYSRHNKRGDAE